jgi:hypothetical protein
MFAVLHNCLFAILKDPVVIIEIIGLALKKLVHFGVNSFVEQLY